MEKGKHKSEKYETIIERQYWKHVRFINSDEVGYCTVHGMMIYKTLNWLVDMYE